METRNYLTERPPMSGYPNYPPYGIGCISTKLLKSKIDVKILNLIMKFLRM